MIEPKPGKAALTNFTCGVGKAIALMMGRIRVRPTHTQNTPGLTPDPVSPLYSRQPRIPVSVLFFENEGPRSSVRVKKLVLTGYPE